jgi:HD superfamily phosphohydrolase
VYLHKTSLVADLMLKNAVLRAKDLSRTAKLNKDVSGNLNLFLTQKLSETNFADYIDNFAALDDYDIIQALKGWMQSDDKILSTLSTSIINRKLFSIEFLALEKADEKYNSLKQHYSEEEMKYLVLKGAAQNNAYNPAKDNIYIKFKDGSIKEITDITEQWNIRSLSNPVVKHYIAYPKNKF